MREGKEGAGSCQGTARQDVFVAFGYTKLALLMEWGGCRYSNPESRPQWLWVWKVLAVSGTLTRFSYSISCELRGWHGTWMTQVPCSTLAGGALGAGLHVLIYSGLSKGPGSYYLLPR